MLESFLSFSKLDNLHHFLLPQSVANISFAYYMRLSTLRVSQFQLRPPPPQADPRALPFFFLPWMANSRRWGLFSCQMPRPLSTLQHFSLIAQSSSAILSILMCDFLFQLTSSFVTVLLSLRLHAVATPIYGFSIIFVIKLMIF